MGGLPGLSPLGKSVCKVRLLFQLQLWQRWGHAPAQGSRPSAPCCFQRAPAQLQPPAQAPCCKEGMQRQLYPLHHSPKGGRSPGVLALAVGAGYRHGAGATG